MSCVLAGRKDTHILVYKYDALTSRLFLTPLHFECVVNIVSCLPVIDADTRA